MTCSAAGYTPQSTGLSRDSTRRPIDDPKELDRWLDAATARARELDAKHRVRLR